MITDLAFFNTSPDEVCFVSGCASFCDCAAAGCGLLAFLPATEVFPVKISIKLLFIERHIICVRNNPDAPTIPPTETNRISLMAIPAIAPATPLNELSSEIVMGISAPPTRMEKAYPKSVLIAILNNRIMVISTVVPKTCPMKAE